MARRSVIVVALAAAALSGAAARARAAAPTAALRFVDGAPHDAALRIIDARAREKCERASLPGARCLPAAELLDADGRPVDFHALRWLLGTIGLTGAERVLVVAADGAEASAVGALVFLAGQRDVAVLDRPPTIAPGAGGGTSRSMTREDVFVAPMRDLLLVAGPESVSQPAIESGRPLERLVRFARVHAGGAQPMRLRLSP